VINRIADLSLLVGYLYKEKLVNSKVVRAALSGEVAMANHA